jgi:hypothetical protein
MKSKVTLSIGNEYLMAGKEESKRRHTSLSELMKQGIEKQMEKEKLKKKEALDFLSNLIPERKKRTGDVDWKKEIKDWVAKKHG